MRQGSNRLEHWSINFRFEPTPFEDDPSLLVHRGMYEAAKVWKCTMPLHTSAPLHQHHLLSIFSLGVCTCTFEICGR